MYTLILLHIIILTNKRILDYLRIILKNLRVTLFKIINNYRWALFEFLFEKNRCDPLRMPHHNYIMRIMTNATRGDDVRCRKKKEKRIKPLCRPLKPPIVRVARRSEVLIGSCLRIIILGVFFWYEISTRMAFHFEFYLLLSNYTLSL